MHVIVKPPAMISTGRLVDASTINPALRVPLPGLVERRHDVLQRRVGSSVPGKAARSSASQGRACTCSSSFSSIEFLGATLHDLTQLRLLGRDDLHVLARDDRLSLLFERRIQRLASARRTSFGLKLVEKRHEDALPLPVQCIHADPTAQRRSASALMLDF